MQPIMRVYAETSDRISWVKSRLESLQRFLEKEDEEDEIEASSVDIESDFSESDDAESSINSPFGFLESERRLKEQRKRKM